MVHFIGASGLAGLFRKFFSAEKRRYGLKIFAVGGLSFNPKANNGLKILQNLLRQGPLRGRQDIVICHVVISTTVSAHSTKISELVWLRLFCSYLLRLKTALRQFYTCEKRLFQTLLHHQNNLQETRTFMSPDPFRCLNIYCLSARSHNPKLSRSLELEPQGTTP